MWYQEVTFSGKYKWYDKKAEEYFNKYFDVLKNFIESIRKYQYKFRFNVEDEVIKEEYMDYLIEKHNEEEICKEQFVELSNSFDKYFFLNLIYYKSGYESICEVLSEVDVLKERLKLLYPDFSLDEISVNNHPCECVPNIRVSISNSKGDVKRLSTIGNNFRTVEYITDKVEFNIDYLNEENREEFLESYYLFHDLEFFKVSWNYILVKD